MRQRIVLSLATIDDAEFIVDIKTNPDLWPYEVGIQTDKDTMRNTVLQKMEGKWHNQFIIQRNDDANTPIGEFHIHLCDEERRSYEIGYCVFPEYRGHGYSIEAGKMILALAFEEWKAHRVFAMCNEHNIASYHVMEKLGMVREGVFRKELPWGDGWVDQLFYAIVDHEYFGG